MNCVVPDWILTERAQAELARMTPADRAAAPTPIPVAEVAAAVLELIADDGLAGRVAVLGAGCAAAPAARGLISPQERPPRADHRAVTTSLGQLWRRRDAVVEHAGLALAGVRAGGPFHARLADALDRAARLETGVAVLLVGVRADDALVRRVTACTRASDTAAALGDDLLAVLVEPVSRSGDAERVAARVVELLDAAPAGLAHAGPEEIDGAELLRHAGLALDHAQRERRGGLVAFDPALLDAVAERAQLAADLPGRSRAASCPSTTSRCAAWRPAGRWRSRPSPAGRTPSTARSRLRRSSRSPRRTGRSRASGAGCCARRAPRWARGAPPSRG